MIDMCFGLNEQMECNVLRSKVCQGSMLCPFYKTCNQAAADEARAFARLRTLPESQQFTIAATYYGGTMPWRKDQK